MKHSLVLARRWSWQTVIAFGVGLFIAAGLPRVTLAQSASASAALQTKVDALEARLKALEDGRHTVLAPFQVVNAKGKPVFEVAEGPLGFYVRAGDSADPHVNINRTSAGGVAITLENNQKRGVSMSWSPTTVYVGAFDDNKGEEAALVVGPELTGFRSKSGSQFSANLGKATGKNSALRVFDAAGKSVVSIGSNPGEGGAGAVYVGTGNGSNVGWLIATAAGKGSVGATNNGIVAAYGMDGKTIAAIGPSTHGKGGNLTTYDAAGTGVFSAGAASDGLGEACVGRITEGGKSKLACLGVSAR